MHESGQKYEYEGKNKYIDPKTVYIKKNQLYLKCNNFIMIVTIGSVNDILFIRMKCEASYQFKNTMTGDLCHALITF